MDFKIEKDVDHSQAFTRNLSQLKGVSIKAGITKRVANITNDKSDTKLVEYASVNEFGVFGRVPSRPFLRSTFDDKEKKWFGIIDSKIESVLTESGGASKTTEQVGQIMEEAIKGKIKSNIPPPNAPETLANKQGSNTLIDTGLMLNSIKYEVIKK
jgi:phage gpG-like protein